MPFPRLLMPLLGVLALTSLPARAATPPAPDYANPAMWAAGANGPGPAAALPAGASPVARRPAVDVFYLHPTTFRSTTENNQDPADPAANGWTDASAIARQASAFTGCCRVFAPRYRAASYLPGLQGPAHDAAFALAYGDVERAFDWYLAHENKGRPFILAGHSQGAAHIAALLERRIDGQPLARRMVAAYVVGINLVEGEFGLRFKHLSPCRQPAQTGCVLQWNALVAGSNVAMVARMFAAPFIARYGDRPDKTPLCINPVTFAANRPDAPASASLGVVPGDPGAGPMLPLRKAAVAVACEGGLALATLAPGLDLPVLPGGSLHYHDFGLFWADIRANASLRARAFLRRKRG